MRKCFIRIIVSLLLVCLLIRSVAGNSAWGCVKVYANATDDLKAVDIHAEEIEKMDIVNEAMVRERIIELCYAMGIKDVDFNNLKEQRGIFFTVDGKKCKKHSYSGAGNCTNCRNVDIIKQLQNPTINENGDKLELPQRLIAGETENGTTAQLPISYTPGGGYMTPSARTCVGFAHFAFWYLFREDANSTVYPRPQNSVAATKDLINEYTICQDFDFSKNNKENLNAEKLKLRMGDLVEAQTKAAGSHAMIFLGYAENGIWVLDCNAVEPQRVSIHVFDYLYREERYSGKITVTRAPNYEPDYIFPDESADSEQSDNDSTAIYYHYTDGKGNYSYCGEKVEGFWRRIFSVFRREKSVFSEEKSFKEGELTRHQSVAHKKHWFSQKCDIADCDVIEFSKDGISWYRVESSETKISTDTTISTDEEEIVETERSSVSGATEEENKASSEVLTESVESEENTEASDRIMGFIPWTESGLEDHVMVWGDEVLESRMREKTGIYDREIMLSDVWEIEELDLTMYDWDSTELITNISALGELTNLRRLELASNNVSDISALSNLINLTRLNLNYNDFYNYVANGEPVIPADFDFNKYFNWVVSDITSVYELTNLEWLGLNGCYIADINGMGKLKKLKHLELAKTGISDISVLGELTNLEYLVLGCNDIVSGTSVLVNLPRLERLEIHDKQIVDFSIEQVQCDVFQHYESSGWTRGILNGPKDIEVYDLDTSYSSNILYYFHICGTEGKGVAHYSHRYNSNSWKLESVHFE